MRRVLPQPRCRTGSPELAEGGIEAERGTEGCPGGLVGGRRAQRVWAGICIASLDTEAASGRHPISQWLQDAPYLMR